MRLTLGNCDHCGTQNVKVVSIPGILPLNTCKGCDVNGHHVKLSTYKSNK